MRAWESLQKCPRCARGRSRCEPGHTRALAELTDPEVVELFQVLRARVVAHRDGGLELFEYIHPKAIESKPTSPNEIGMHRVAFSVDDTGKALEIAARHGCRPLRGVATYEYVYKLTYVRGPSGIIVMLAEELKKN